MGKDKPSKTISWEQLQSMGNPEAAPISEAQPPKAKTVVTERSKVRVYLERKGRGGKSVTLIKGIDLGAPQLDDLCKKLKSTCGVGGKREGSDIMMQGDQRTKVIDVLIAMGYKDVKNAGA